MNALEQGSGIPEYGQIQADDIRSFFPGAISSTLEKIEEYEAGLQARLDAGGSFEWEEVIPALSDICEPVYWAWGAVSHLNSVRNATDFREAKQEQQPAVIELGSRVAQSKALYDALISLRDNPATPLSDTQKRILKSDIDGMVNSGVGFDGELQDEFNAANQRKAELSSNFSNNSLDATAEWSYIITDAEEADGIPERVLSSIRQEDGTWKITLDAPTYGPVLTYAKNRELRELVYRAHVTKAAEVNTPILEEILKLRQVQAKRLGFNNWAEVSLSAKMADSVEEIEDLFSSLVTAATPIAREDKATLLKFAQALGFEGDKLEPWDGGFYAAKLVKAKFELDSEALRPYFPFDQVLDGLFGLVRRLFEVEVVAADGEAPVWHPDVRYFRINDLSGTQIASFFLDPFARPGEKRGGAWMDECVTREKGVLPIAYLTCNQTPPNGDTPSLMSFGEVTTLFHEFGHGLQHMLTQIDEPGASGINLVDWDAVELPSQFMENWCLDRQTLFGMARHYETGEQLPEAEYRKLKDSETFFTAGGTLRQAYLALTDLRLHYQWDPEAESADAFRRRVADEILLTPPIEEDRSLCSFGHIFAGGYAAGYYSYKWAEVLSADAFAAFEEVGLDNEEAIRETGKRFRDTVLSLGGSLSPAEVFKAFRGRAPSTEALIRHSGLSS